METGIVMVPMANGELILIPPVYKPGERLLASAVTVILEAVIPLVGDTVSHGPPEVPIKNGKGRLELLSVNVWDCGVGLWLTATKEIALGGGSNEASTVKLTGTTTWLAAL